ncbi:MAG: 7-cyano-7-deazaguanine synthase QueC [Candidatus Bathyarchaeota archaeon]|nr:MAG: 7-cyano-7-deazaguanine synthase QueC [Candidatus Bathyarchaeum tardum]WNZ29912.1 MAG: 7-cyano-7-deazaguanine synthase QueC [Candidatus Bathyarchaeota archaeon]
MTENQKCVVVLSGGPDSVTTAYWAKNQGYTVHGLTCKYGQIASKEVEHAKLIAEKLGITLKVIDLSSLREIYMGITSVCDENITMTGDFSQPIIVPFRNAIFLSVAVAYASSVGANKIFYGAQGSDEQFYPDCRPQFYKSFEETARQGTDENITVEAPFSGGPKSEIIKQGTELGVPFELTWSCYFGREKHCGTCESCMNRKRAFEQAQIQDPTEYEK